MNAKLKTENEEKRGIAMKKVMVFAVEDLCGVLCNELDDTYMVYPCANALDAQELLLQKPDVLIMNLFLPDMDSLEFLRTNAATLPPVVIALTPLISHDLLLAVNSLDVTCLMRIPFWVECLKEQLAEHLAQKRGLSLE